MAMDKINGSPLLRQGVLDNSRQSDRVGKDGKPVDVLSEIAPAANKPAGGDTAEISDTAHRLMELRQAVDSGRVALDALPEVRPEKLEIARMRIKSGFYNSADVRERVATGVANVIKGIEEL